jgi:carboxymethylenebutenolidase
VIATEALLHDDVPLVVARPDGPPRGGLVLLQEAFGVNDHIVSVAVRLAAEG